VHPDRVVRNSTSRPGDILFLTKPLGTGIVSTAIKADMVDSQLENKAIRWMTTLNRDASKLMLEYGATACTDVTGFGMIGHAYEMAEAGGVTFEIDVEAIPVLGGVRGLVCEGLVPAGCYRNRDHYSGALGGNTRVETEEELLSLFDPQTSGGLLISIPPEQAALFSREAFSRGIFTAQIGRVMPRRECAIFIA
jgi:selenide,water dikinase